MNHAWLGVHLHLGQSKRDFYALQNAFSSRMNPPIALMHNENHTSCDALLEEDAVPTAVKPSDRKSATYLYETSERGREDDPDDFGVDEDHGDGEFERRHPGTSWESDDEERQ